MKKFINGFGKGIDRDTSVNKYDNEHYFEAVNLRLLPNNSLSSGALSLINGTTSKASLSLYDTVVGYTSIRDNLYLFVKGEDEGKIYRFIDDQTNDLQSVELIYSNPDLIFYDDYPVRAIGNYENDVVQKIYFTDGEHFFYHLNVYSETYPIDNTEVTINQLEIVSQVDFENISLELTTGGNLTAGKIQYAYQLYNRNGAETVFSPTSRLISLVEASESLVNTLNYVGSEVGKKVNKSIQVTITNNGNTFNRVRLIALEYQTFNQLPTVRIVGEYEIDDNQSITLLDSGQSIGELTVEEFRFIQNDIIPKTIEVKNNLMIAGNIKYNYFNISDEYDTRVFRFRDDGGGSYSCVVKDGNNDIIVPVDLTVLPDLTTECFNTFNNIDLDNAGKTNEYKYNPQTGEIGGLGKYINYKFTTKQVLLDDNIKSYDFKLGYPRIISRVSNPIENYANPLTDVGYQRDEIYRFGIVFFDKKGRPSFTKWIGDIRFPNNEDLPFISYAGGKTYANILGIQFYVDLESGDVATTLRDSISGYQIVRVERDSTNSTIVDQGVISYLGYGGDGNGVNDDSEMRYSASLVPYLYECFNETVTDDRRSEYIPNLSEDNVVVQNTFELDPNHIEFNSPKIAINKNSSIPNSSKIELIGYLGDPLKSYITQREFASFVCDKYNSFTPSSFDNLTKVKASPIESKVYTPVNPGNSGDSALNDLTLYVMNDGYVYNNQCKNFAPNSGANYPHYAMRGTFQLFNFDPADSSSKLIIPSDPTFTGIASKANRVMFANIRVNKNRSIYNGTDYNSRKNSSYVKASEFQNIWNEYIDVYNGDTYINVFVYLRGIYNEDTYSNAVPSQSILMFPCESRYNLNLRLDNIQRYMQWGRPKKEIDGEIINNYALTESLSEGVGVWSNYYPQEVGDLYRYNSVYSTENKAFEFSEKPFDFVESTRVDTRITASDKKINGEYNDNWLKFKFNEFVDIDSRYHGLVRLINVNNNIYFIQPKAVGVLSINDRSLITDNNAGKLVLGTGDVLSRYDYITTSSGASTYDAIVKSDTTFYYVDERRKRFYGFTGTGPSPLSLIKGVNSYLDGLAYNTVELEFDPTYNEVLVNIDGTIIAYNEIIQAFTSFYSYNPSKFIRLDENIYVIKGSAGESTNLLLINNTDYALVDDDPVTKVVISDGINTPGLYRLNSGQPGEFFTEAGVGPLSASVTLVINPDGNIINVFDNIDIRTDVRDSNDNDVPFETITSLIANNNYQSITKNLSFSSDPSIKGSIEKIARIWRTSLVADTTYNANPNRLVDTFLILKLNYDSNGNSFKIHDITTYYRSKNH